MVNCDDPDSCKYGGESSKYKINIHAKLTMSSAICMFLYNQPLEAFYASRYLAHGRGRGRDQQVRPVGKCHRRLKLERIAKKLKKGHTK